MTLIPYETKLKRFREEQERKRNKDMSKSHRKEIAKRLKQEIDACTDPETLIRLTTQYAKVLPKQRRTRKLVEKTPITQPDRLSKRRDTGTEVDRLADAEWLLHDTVLQIEAKCRARGGWLKLTRAEKDTIKAEVIGKLTAEERAAIEALGTRSTGVA